MGLANKLTSYHHINTRNKNSGGRGTVTLIAENIQWLTKIIRVSHLIAEKPESQVFPTVSAGLWQNVESTCCLGLLGNSQGLQKVLLLLLVLILSVVASDL